MGLDSSFSHDLRGSVAMVAAHRHCHIKTKTRKARFCLYVHEIVHVGGRPKMLLRIHLGSPGKKVL